MTDKYETLMTYGPVNDLYKAAAALLASLGEVPEFTPELVALQSAVESCREAVDSREQFADAIALAREDYANNEVEIDDDPVLSVSDEGVWVSAWVWVPLSAEQMDPMIAKAAAIFQEHGLPEIDGTIEDNDGWLEEDGGYEYVIHTLPHGADGDAETEVRVFRVVFDEHGEVKEYGFV